MDPATVALAFGMTVTGAPVEQAYVDGFKRAWSSLEDAREPGSVSVQVNAYLDADGAIELPPCAGRGEIKRDGQVVPTTSPGPVVIPLVAGLHTVIFRVVVSAYEKRIACGYAPRIGVSAPAKDGLATLTYGSPSIAASGGRAVVFIPPGHDAKKPATVLVGLHPWNGTMWTYTAYAELLDEAAKRDVVLLFPTGLGNSLYTAPAEEEVMRAIEALKASIAVDGSRVSLWGASMGGAGATTIGFHRPDQFASATSFFGDSYYDLKSYVRLILHDEAGAHQVNALDISQNARNLPVWLIHGEDDRVSPIHQSDVLARALKHDGYAVRFDRMKGFGHAGALVAKFAREVVARASDAKVPTPRRVTYVSVRPNDTSAYGIHFVRDGEASIDLAREDDGAIHVLEASYVKSIVLDPGALGAAPSARIVDDSGARVHVTWRP